MSPSLSISVEEIMGRVTPMVDLGVSRNAKYGNSIIALTNHDMVKLVIMKLIRTANMLEHSTIGSGALDPKWYDEIADSINYLNYTLLRWLNPWECATNVSRSERVEGDDYGTLVEYSKDCSFINKEGYLREMKNSLSILSLDEKEPFDPFKSCKLPSGEVSYGSLLHITNSLLWSEATVSRTLGNREAIVTAIAQLFVILRMIESEHKTMEVSV